tara:strand:+ start:742 stop:948 length:207 start_codon:yes stop_codon:yes gene_type:complete
MSENKQSMIKELNETKVRLMKAEEELVKLKAELIEKDKLYNRTLQIGAALVLRACSIREQKDNVLIPI